MTQLYSTTLDNEMDMLLAHQKTMKAAELLLMNISTKTTFTTAVLEVARVVIENTGMGELRIGLNQTDARCYLRAQVLFNNEYGLITENDFHYAKKLIPIFELDTDKQQQRASFAIGLPRSISPDKDKLARIVHYLNVEMPKTPYEEVKLKMLDLSQESAQKTKELEESNYINDLKNEFISMASHELKTPLTVIRANAQLLNSNRISTLEQAVVVAASIQKQCEKLTYLANQLIDTVKIENARFIYVKESLDFNDYLHDLLTDLHHLVPEHELQIDLASSVQVELDRLRMEQVIANLLSNAAKYSEKGTNIIVKTHHTLPGILTMSVSDQGIGMSADSLTKIFDKFYRDESVMYKYAGLGMGMYISSKIVQDHGGHIWAESIPERGSTFYVSIPILSS